MWCTNVRPFYKYVYTYRESSTYVKIGVYSILFDEYESEYFLFTYALDIANLSSCVMIKFVIKKQVIPTQSATEQSSTKRISSKSSPFYHLAREHSK